MGGQLCLRFFRSYVQTAWCLHQGSVSDMKKEMVKMRDGFNWVEDRKINTEGEGCRMGKVIPRMFKKAIRNYITFYLFKITYNI